MTDKTIVVGARNRANTNRVRVGKQLESAKADFICVSSRVEFTVGWVRDRVTHAGGGFMLQPNRRQLRLNYA